MRIFLDDILEVFPEALGLFDSKDELVESNSLFREIYAENCELITPGICYEEMLRGAVTAGLIAGVQLGDETWFQCRFAEHNDTSSQFLLELSNGKIFESIQKRIDDGSTLIFNRDVTENRRFAETQSIQEKKSQAMLDNVFDGVITISEDGIIDYLSKPAEKIFCTKNTVYIGEKITSLLCNASLSSLLDPKALGSIREYIGVRNQSEKFPLEVAINKLKEDWLLVERRQQARHSYVATIRDITEPKRIAHQLQQAHKMDAIGTLAGGIAHDFNNILSIIMGYGSLLQDKSPEGSEHRENVDMVLQAARRARDLVKQILIFSQPNEEEKTFVDICLIAREVLAFIRRTVSSTIDIVHDFPDQEIGVFADASQLHRVMVNLCTNATQAIGENVGQIKVTINQKEILVSDKINGLDPGQYVEVVVSDTGSGIDPELNDRIFDPFFTTKDQGHGTGLGLAMVQGIVTDLGGMIVFSSQPGRGTVFNVFLPLAIEGPNKQNVNAIFHVGDGSKTILFVDDEELIVLVGKKVLRALGYEVIGVTSSEEALNLFRADPSRFSMVITDQNMPGIMGDKLVREIRQISLNTPIILCTGYSETVDSTEASRIGVNAFVMKPLDRDELGRIVGEIFAAGSEISGVKLQ